MRVGVGTIVLILWITLTAIVEAGQVGIESDLKQTLQQQRAVVEAAINKVQGGQSAVNEINLLKTKAEEIRASIILLEDKFRASGEAANKLGVKARERHRVMEEGFKQALGEYINTVESLQASAISDKQDSLQQSAISNQLNSLKTLLNKILSKSRRPIHGSLPYRNLNYPAQEPYAGPALKPAYKKDGNRVVRPEDTADTEEAPLSFEIATLAQSLNWNPVLIYEYVKNNIETEWYWGCMKGAEETLRQKSGNDCDQATLLTALLRSSGFPTRYVRGVIEFPYLGHAKNLTGIDDPAKISDFFQKAGIPHKSIISGGSIANFQLEHVWVESRIPYGNYRGTMIDNSNPIWLGLDTSIKVTGYTYNAPLDMFEQSVISSQLTAIRDEYLNTMQTETPLEYLQEKLSALSEQFSAEDYKLTRSLIPEVMNILPASMHYDQLAITHEYTEIPEDLKHHVRFIAKDKNGGELFDLQLSTFQLFNKRIALTYEPETIEDQEIIDSYGGLDNTPAYLVRLRPVLKVNDERVVVGRDGLPMGADYTLTIELISPNGIERVTNTQIIGNLTAIGIVAGKVTPSISPLPQEPTVGAQAGEGGGEGEKDAAQILHEEAIRYIDRWNKAEDELASLLHLRITRPIPTVVTVGGVIDVTYLLDMPHGFEWKGVYMDAGLRAISIQPSAASVGAYGDTPVSSERQKTFMHFSGLQGSVLEHRIFEDDFQVDSISTAKLIQIIGANGGSPILSIDKTNLAAVLSSSDFDDNIKEDIINAVNQGLVVRIPQPLTPDPQSLFSYQDWAGIGYIKENPDTGEAGYMLSGMIAGGMTAVSPNKWLNQGLVEILGRPNAGQYTTISITNPKNESILYTSPISVSGIALDPNAMITLNGQEAYREGNTFTAAGISLTRGMNRITATATNSKGVSVSSSINVTYRILLRAFIAFPYEGATLAVQSVDVEGITTDSMAMIEVNGISATVSPDGRFIARGVALSEGTNQLTVRATNLEGDVDIQTLTVTRQATQAVPIQLTITSPTGNETINRPSVMVKGTVTSTADEVWIKVNGQLAEVHDGQFVANHVPLTEGNNAIIVNATDSSGAVGRAEVQVTAVKAPYVTLNANITSGIPPLTTYFTVTTEIPNAITSYQMDFEGDGIIDYSGPTFEDISHAFTTEGIYYPTVIVTDDQGNVYTDSVAITVLSKVKIGAILKGKWEGMKAKLMRGDIEGAMNYFTDKGRAKYGPIFESLKSSLPEIMQTFVEFNIINIYEIIAEYEVVANENGSLYSYPGILIRGSNGIWKFRDF